MTTAQLGTKRQWLFAMARIYLGISFFFSDHGNAQPNEAAGFLKFALRNGYSWYQSLLNSVVVPHAAVFAKLVVVGEIYVGIALVIGSPPESPPMSHSFCSSIICAPKEPRRGVRASINPISSWHSLSFSATPGAHLGSTAISLRVVRNSRFDNGILCTASVPAAPFRHVVVLTKMEASAKAG